MSPCHACPCITALLPDISCSMRDAGDEAGVAAPLAAVQGEAAAVFSQGFSLSEGLNDDPHLTLDIMFPHTGLQSQEQRGASSRHAGDKHIE